MLFCASAGGITAESLFKEASLNTPQVQTLRTPTAIVYFFQGFVFVGRSQGRLFIFCGEMFHVFGVSGLDTFC